MPLPSTVELRPANLTTKMISRMNLSGTVIIAFISINFGPIASDREIKAQQNKLAQNKEPANCAGSPSLNTWQDLSP